MGVVQLVERRIWDAEDFPGSSPGTHTKKIIVQLNFFRLNYYLYIKYILIVICVNVIFVEKNLKNIKV